MAERTRLTAVALLGLALLTGAGHAQEPDAAVVAAEAKQLSALDATATRQELRLQLRAANGRVVNFDSLHPDGAHEAQFADYRLTGVTPDGRFFTVHGLFYESETTYWVSRTTGVQTEVYAAPTVSPDGRYAVVALAREAFGPEGVFVWEIAGDRLLQRAHLKNGDYGLFDFKRWTGKDSAELALFSHSFLKFCPGAQSTTATVRLTRGSQGWTLAEPASSRDVRCE
jgi:hypothetical protein